MAFPFPDAETAAVALLSSTRACSPNDPAGEMTVQETERPPRRPLAAPRERSAGSLALDHIWWLVAGFVVVISLVILLLARTRPGYDPYGWLVWGHQTLHLSLNLGGAPSWKPLPYIFTVPYGLFGHYALWLWMVTAVSISLAGPIVAGRIAYRLVGTARGQRYPAIAAAIVGGLAVLAIEAYAHYILSVQSDPMIVTLCLAAVDCHLSRRPLWAFGLLVLAALGRPETWPFLGIYAIWAWRELPRMRPLLYAGLALVPILWFGIPTITNHRPLLAGELAELSPHQLHQNKIVGTVQRFLDLQFLPIKLAALAAVAIAAYRRDRTVLVLAGAGVLWVLIEIGFVLHGWPGVQRYMFEPAGVAAVLAGVGIGWILQAAPRVGRGIPAWAGILLVAVFVGAVVPDAVSAVRSEQRDLGHERSRTTEINKLKSTITSLGGYKRILACGRPVTDVEYVSVLGWYIGLNTGVIGYRPQFELAHTYPIVLLTALPNGWAVKPYHVPASNQAACAGLDALYVPTARHPHGVLVRK